MLPWEKYASASASPQPVAQPAPTSQPSGPWNKYAPVASPLPAPAATPVDVPTGDWHTQSQDITQPDGHVTHISQPSELASFLAAGPRAFGIAGRNIAEAAGAIPTFLANSGAAFSERPEHPADSGIGNVISGQANAPLPDPVIPNIGGMAADAVGLPKPEGNAENLISAAQQGATGAALPLGAGKLVEGVAPRLAGVLTAKPVTQIVSGAAGAEAGETTKELGGGPGMQLAASLIGGGAPLVAPSTAGAVTRRLIRGGSGGAARMNDNISAFEGAGSFPTLGQATEGIPQAFEGSVLAKAPLSGEIIRNAGINQQKAVGAKVGELADKLDPNRSDQMEVGNAIKRGITKDGPKTSFVNRTKEVQNRLYDALDVHLDPAAEVSAANTISAIKGSATPITGAENLSKSSLITDPIYTELNSLLEKDIGGRAPAPTGLLDASGKPIMDAGIPAKDTLPYSSLKLLRSKIGDKLSSFDLSPDIDRKKLSEMYGALSSDMEGAAKSAGPDAHKAFQRANNYTRARAARLDILNDVVNANGGPEYITKAAQSGTKEGATRIRAVMQSLDPDNQKVLAGSILRNMGMTTGSNQNAERSIFSTERFLTNTANTSDPAKAAIFDRMGPDFRKNLQDVWKVAENLRKGSAAYRNPGSVQAMRNVSTLGAMTVGLLTGHVGTASAIGAGVGAAGIAAKAFTSPIVVRWLARSSHRPLEAAPQLLNQLSLEADREDDPDAKEVANYLKEHLANPPKPDTQNTSL